MSNLSLVPNTIDAPGAHRAAPLQSSLASPLFEKCGVDILDPFAGEPTNAGQKYTLFFNEYCSRYRVSVPILNKKADTVVNAFNQHMVTKFGSPSI